MNGLVWMALLAGCGRGETVPTISIDGSSTVFPLTEAVAEEYRAAGKSARVTIGISGTGGGFQKFCSGETDISNASRPIKPSEVELCAKNGVAYVEIPVAFDGLAVIVHPSNDWVEALTTAELKRMWEPEAQGRVTKWSDVRPDWPDRPLHLYGAGVDSGTYDYFTSAIVGKEHSSRGDFTSSEDDNTLVQGVATDAGGLGFLGLAYYTENADRLKLVPVDDGDPENGAGPVLPDQRTVNDGTYQPLSRPEFIYVAARGASRPEIVEFVHFYLDAASTLATEVGYVPLPKEAYATLRGRFDRRLTGSVFGGQGSKVGVTTAALVSDAGLSPHPGD